MLDLMHEQFGIGNAESLSLLTQSMEDYAENPAFEALLTDISKVLSLQEKEEFAVMMLKVVAADGNRDADEMAKLRSAAEIIEIPPEVLHRAYDRYFEETQG